MKIEEFVAGEKHPCYQYSCFVPTLVNQDWSWDSRELTLALEGAVKALAGLDACAQFVPDIGLFIRMHVVREASASSRIADSLACGYQAANRLVKPLLAAGVLVPSSDAKRNTIYDFKRYLDIFKD